jgi:hypothetical protein
MPNAGNFIGVKLNAVMLELLERALRNVSFERLTTFMKTTNKPVLEV